MRSSTASASSPAAADDLVIAEKRHYLRGRDLAEMNAILRDGAREGGFSGEIEAYPTELGAPAGARRPRPSPGTCARSWPTSSASEHLRVAGRATGFEPVDVGRLRQVIGA